MAMSLNFPTPFNSMSIINPDLIDPHNQPASFTAIRFWWNYYGVRAEAFTEFVKFMEPRLKRCEDDLEEFEATEDTSWIRSMKMELENDTAMLNFMKLNNRIYGSMYTRVKDFEATKKDDEAKIKNLARELKELQEHFIQDQQKQKQDEIKLEKKITKLGNLILSSNSDVDEKAKKTMKFCHKYSENLKQLELQTQELREKSGEAMEAFELYKSETISALVQIYQDTVTNRNECFDEFRRAAEYLRSGSAVAFEIEPVYIIANAIRTQRKSIRLHRFQTSAELIGNSQPCREYFKMSNTPLDMDSSDVPATDDTANEEIHAPVKEPEVHDRRTIKNDEKTDVKSFCVAEEESYDEHPAKVEEKLEPAVKLEPVAKSTINKEQKGKMAGKSKNNELTTVMPFRQQESDEEEWDSCFQHDEPSRPLPKQPKASVNNTERDKLDVFITDTKSVSSKTVKPIRTLPEPKTAIKISKQDLDIINRRPVDNTNKDLSSEQPQASSSSEQLARLSELDLSFDTGEEILRPLPSKPSSCWEEKGNAQSHKTERQASFTPYKTRVIKAYTKDADNQMSVKKGEIIKIISRPDSDGYVMARKKRFFRYKIGLIPIYVV